MVKSRARTRSGDEDQKQRRGPEAPSVVAERDDDEAPLFLSLAVCFLSLHELLDGGKARVSSIPLVLISNSDGGSKLRQRHPPSPFPSSSFPLLVIVPSFLSSILFFLFFFNL
ncbi:uncharacterized protein DS421_4g116380 [Arachis hypogaea]|nr:uncharacterized protein DS421_4g116380 [Arachis hypogaea]